MKLIIKISSVQTAKNEKNYWINLWRIGNNMNKIADIIQMFAEGKIYTDETVAGVIDGVGWRR